MRNLSTLRLLLLLIVLLALSHGSLQAENWPMDGKPDLSSGFGDFRPGHFHGGVDLRTGGKIGRKVNSPVDGYVWRVKMSYSGYGKGLYIRDYNGNIYVFGHLSKMVDKIRKPVRIAQVNAYSYAVDLNFPKDSIKIKKGELIAYSGQSGAGAPHLHFEKRTPDNQPLNPVAHGFNLADDIRPVFDRVVFKMTDDSSLFDDTSRKMFINSSSSGSNGKYTIDTLLYFNRPFGLLVDCFDMMRVGGMKQSVYKLTLKVDGQQLYSSTFDSFDYSMTHSVDLEYDFKSAADNSKRVRRLFNRVGNNFLGSKSFDSKGAIWGNRGDETIGRHTATIIAEDVAGNRSTLEFDFLWGPTGNLFTLDGEIEKVGDTSIFNFSPEVGWENLGIDSAVVLLNRGNQWGVVKGSSINLSSSGKLEYKVTGKSTDRALLQLVLFFKGKATTRDNLFNGLWPLGKMSFDVKHDFVDRGLRISINARAKRGYKSRVELYYKGELLGTEYPHFYNMKTYVAYISPKPEYKRIDQIGVALADTGRIKMLDPLFIAAIGYEEDEEIIVDKQFSIQWGKKNFYEPRFVEVKKTIIRTKVLKHIDSELYQLFPKAYAVAENFGLTYRFKSTIQDRSFGGICWLDEKKDSWVWLDNDFNDFVLTSESRGGGYFATVLDYNPPVISRLNIYNKKTYFNQFQPIRFIVKDTLSGIGDQIKVKLDGDWQIVDYDPETGQCEAIPYNPLKNGSHHLAIEIKDKAGNLTEQYLNFIVRERRKGR